VAFSGCGGRNGRYFPLFSGLRDEWRRVLPRGAADARLSQADGEESDADVVRMRVGYVSDVRPAKDMLRRSVAND
jgi:hypothetical protein